MRYLTIALTKGRLAEKTLEMLEAVGITCEEMKDQRVRMFRPMWNTGQQILVLWDATRSWKKEENYTK